MTHIRMIALDFDNTLIGHDNGLPVMPADTKALLLKLIAEGIEVGIASGRRWRDMRAALAYLGLSWGRPFPTFIVTRETFLYWMQDGEMVPDRAWNEARGWEMEQLARALLGKAPTWLTALEEAGLHITGWILWSDYGLEFRLATIEEAERARQILKAHTADWAQARVHRNRFLAHIALATAGKGKTLRWATEARGLAPHQVLAIGDSLNDWDMLDGSQGFWSGAVGNADEQLKEKVREVGGVIAEQPAGAGVAEIIAAYRRRGLL